MLGSMNDASDWQWAAYGKHPVAKDYVSLCERLPLAKTFSNWLDKGFQLLPPEANAMPRYCSWRFWAGGARGNTLACGLLRDSRDGVGRSYPFMILGSGSLNRWYEHWDLLPFACEKAWGQMEKVSVKNYEHLRTLEDEIQRIPPPYPQWPEFVKQKESLWGGTGDLVNESSPDVVGSITEQVRSMGDASEFYIPLSQWSSADPYALVSCWHSLLKAHSKETPNVVFMGGTPDNVRLAVYRRPLVANDFVRLWCGE